VPQAFSPGKKMLGLEADGSPASALLPPSVLQGLVFYFNLDE
jgi:hypothetical protein